MLLVYFDTQSATCQATLYYCNLGSIVIEKLNSFNSILTKLGIIAITLLTLFGFANLTTEFFETPKFLALVVFLILILILSTIKYVFEGKIVLSITPLDLPLILLVVVAFISTFTSESYYISLLGSAPRFYGSLISIVTLFIFYILLTNNLRSTKDIKPIIYSLMISGIVLSALSLLSYFGIKILPFSWTQTDNFTPTGSSFSTAALVSLLIPFILISLVRSTNPVLKIANAMILALFGTTLVLIGSFPTHIATTVAVVLTFFYNLQFFKGGLRNLNTQTSLVSLLLPALIIAGVAILSFVKFPTEFGKLSNNVFYQKAQSFPREIQLPFDISWNVSISSFRDAPLWGTGPATYLLDFTAYKPASFNSFQYWNINFDQPFNEYLSLLATLGGVGLVAFLILTAIAVSLSLRVLSNKEVGAEYGDNQPVSLAFMPSQMFTNKNDDIKLSLAISCIVLFVLLALHVLNLVVAVIGFIILASFFAINQQFVKTVHIRLGAIRSSSDSGLSFDLLPLILIVLMLAIAGGGYYYIGKFAWADYHHRQALELVAANNPLEAYNQLVKAEQLNPYNDLYRLDIAQTNFAIANAIASAKGPSESSPSGSLTDQDKTNIQTLLQQSIAEGRSATAINPRSTNNWQVLANIYRQISGVAQNALQFSLEAYGRAIQKDPMNPSLRLNVGGLYYSLKNYDMAIRFFSDSINLKPDFTNGYYNLAIALRDKGDLQNAQVISEQLVSILQKDTESQDYKTATQLLSDLKSKTSTSSAGESQLAPNSLKETSALQDKKLPKLPKVLDSQKIDNIATPEAVKK